MVENGSSQKTNLVKWSTKFIATQQKCLVGMPYEKCAKNMSVGVSQNVFAAVRTKSQAVRIGTGKDRFSQRARILTKKMDG